MQPFNFTEIIQRGQKAVNVLEKNKRRKICILQVGNAPYIDSIRSLSCIQKGDKCTDYTIWKHGIDGSTVDGIYLDDKKDEAIEIFNKLVNGERL